MNGDVPAIYWYLFWVGLVIVMEAFGFFMATIIHRRNMRVLDLLKSYADKGIEPPRRGRRAPQRAGQRPGPGVEIVAPGRAAGALHRLPLHGVRDRRRGVVAGQLRRAGLGGLSDGVRGGVLLGRGSGVPADRSRHPRALGDGG